jgi:B12 binding domain/HTH domain
MYRRYTFEEIKRKIIDILQSAGSTGLSGVELADRTGINRMTITKYLDVMYAMGLLKKKKVGTVNIWFLHFGVGDIDFPIDYSQVQQKLISSILAGDEDHARRILLIVMNSTIEHARVITEIMVPILNTIGELYSRGRLNKTERIFLLNLMMELIDLIKFNVKPTEHKVNAQVVCVAGSEDRVYVAKSAAVALLSRGWSSTYIGNVGDHIDPFFDIDFQRYLLRLWTNKRGLMLICVFSSGEGSVRFLTTTANGIKGKIKGELRIAVVTTQQLQLTAEENSDYVGKDISALVEWAEREFNFRKEI